MSVKEGGQTMATNNSQLVYHKIKSLEVQGGFLDGVKIKFDDNLNCLIGGRGTGKTTVIESKLCNPLEKQVKQKLHHPEEASEKLPKELRGKYYDTYWQVCLALGCNQGKN